MEKKLNLKELKWVHQPDRFVVREDKIIIETEPHTSLNLLGGSAEGVEMELVPTGNFHFSIRCDFQYKNTLDQCGIVLYDRSEREIGSGIQWLYYRIWLRGGIVRVQYSFNGKRYSDLREFVIGNDEVKLGIYACSPRNSSFDCIFSEAILDEEVKV